MDIIQEVKKYTNYSSKLEAQYKTDDLNALKIPLLYQGPTTSDQNNANKENNLIPPGIELVARQIIFPKLSNAKVTCGLLIINIVIFIFLTTQGLDQNQSLTTLLQVSPSVLLKYGGSQSNTIYYQGEFWRWETACFLHANLWNLFFNGVIMVYFMSAIEKSLGPLNTLIIYLLSGFGGNIIGSALKQNKLLIGVGADVCLYGIIAYLSGYFILNYYAFDKPQLVSLRNIMIWITVIITLLILIVGVVVSSDTSVDSSGHFGGFLMGLSISLFVPKPIHQTDYEKQVRKIGLGTCAFLFVFSLFIFYFFRF